MHAARLLLCLGALALAGPAPIAAQDLPSPDRVRARLRQVNDRFLQAWPEPGRDIVTDRARPSNIWTRATYFEGLMALQKIDPQARYLDYALRWAESHRWDLAYGSADIRHADNQCCGQTYLDLHALDPRPERIARIKAAIDSMVNSARSDDWWWIDALQMAMPVFARLGVLTGDARYFEKMHALYLHTKNVQGGRGLYHPTEHLWWRDADFDPPYLEPNGANCYWSRGNGWVFAALARVLDVLPTDATHRAEYLRTFQDMAAALAPLQRDDGFWNASLTDPDNYGGRELTGTAFFTYGMAWGIRNGHLPRATYLPVVARAWHALAELAVRPDGALGYVQGSGKQPSDGQPVTYDSEPNFDDFGTGAFLLAGSEVYRLTTIPAVDYIGVFNQWMDLTGLPHGPDALFHIEIRGTNLPAAFASVAPRVIWPDGRTERVLTLEPWSGHFVSKFFTFTGPGGLTANHPIGAYAVVLGDQVVRDINLGASGWPPFRPIALAVRNWARPITVDIGEFDALPATDARVRLSIFAAPFYASLEERIRSRVRPTLLLPAFTFSEGTQMGVLAEAEFLTHRQSAVALGTLGSAVVEAGYRSTMTTSTWVVGPADMKERLVNLSSLGFVPAGGDLTAGFVVSAGGPKMVLIRAVGPALQNFGVTNALPNPYLRVFNANRTRAWQNDDWQSTPQYLALTPSGATALQASYANPRDAAVAATEAGAFPLSARSRDAALVLVLPPGNYTAQVTASGNSAQGTALVEVYELTTTQTHPRLTNLSTRGTVSASEALTTGFVITGGPKRVLLRAIGPALAGVGIPLATTLADPRLTLFSATGVTLAQNDNWSDAGDAAAQSAFRASLGAFALPAGSRDAEISLTLPPGAYTVRASSTDGGSGLALIEIYTAAPGS